jgi:hypothetical protein
LLALEKPGEAADALKEGLAAAQVLRHPPTIWRVAAALSRASAASGRDDDAEAAHRTAAEAIQAFAEGLPDDRRAGFVAAEPVRRALAAG